jgi:Polyketide cyclase / dehydrase and lipid transport
VTLRLEARSALAHAVADVFAAASDPVRQLEWDAVTLRRVEMLTDGPISTGTRVRGRFRGFGTVDYEYVAYEPDRTFAHVAGLPMGTMRHTFTFEPTTEGTVMIQLGELEPNLLGRAAAPVVARVMRHRFATIAAEIDRYLRAAQAPPTGAVPDSAG